VNFLVRKYGARVQMSRETLVEGGYLEPTPEERERMEAWAVEYAQRKQAATEALPVFIAQLAAVADPVARVVLDLHKDEGGMCDGCEPGSYAEDRPAWPCITTTSVAATLGITVPPDLWMVDGMRL